MPESVLDVSIHLMLLFIALTGSEKEFNRFSFNTSHVTLYQLADYCGIVKTSRFNTSHVTLYLSCFLT